MIDMAFRSRVEAALALVEQEDGVRILLAVESGSRAWGFPSRDSDYDVRFIFIRPLADYLGISPPRDVIERPIEADLDLGGWDLRKALGLMVRSNAVIFEWLVSPVVYRCDTAVVTALNELARVAVHLPALAYHYDRLARGAWSPGEADIRLKTYFYALRPALSLLWLRNRGMAPPMDLPALLAGVAVPKPVEEVIQTLLRCKAAATEADIIPRQHVLERFLADVLAQSAIRPAAWDREPARMAADSLFKTMALSG